MIKTRIPLAAVILAVGLLTGCQTSNVPLTPDEKSARTIQRAKRITEMATFDAGVLALRGQKNSPANRAVIVGITNQLAGFLAMSNITPSDVSAYIAQLPIKELKTVEGQIIAGAVLMVVDEITGENIYIDAGRLGFVIESAIKGLGRAIQFAEANPYVPPVVKPKPPKQTNAAAFMMQTAEVTPWQRSLLQFSSPD